MRALRDSGASFLLALGLATLSTNGCGGDSGDGGTGGSGTGGSGTGGGGNGGGNATGGSSGKSDEGSGGKSNANMGPSAGGAPSGSVPCGSTVCASMEGSTTEVCCRDQFKGLCGVKSLMGGCVDAPKPPPKGCPVLPAAMGFMVQACCTTMGQCGVDLSMFGQGCVDLTTAAAQAMQMGVSVGQVPPPASCTPGDGGA